MATLIISRRKAISKKNNSYLINSKKVPSVTTVLDVLSKPGLEIWYGKLGIREASIQKQAAADFGSAIHGAIEAINHGQLPHFEDERLSSAVKNFKVWSDTHIDKWVTFEKAVFNDEFGYAGTVDAYAYLKGSDKLTLVDFKSSRKVREEYYLQVAAYANATRIEDNCIDLKKVEHAIIVHLDHSTLTWESVNVILTPDLFEIFKACLSIFKWRNPSK